MKKIILIMLFAFGMSAVTQAQKAATITGTAAVYYNQLLPSFDKASVQLVATKVGTVALTTTVVLVGSNDAANWAKYDIAAADTVVLSNSATNDVRFYIDMNKWKYTALKVSGGATGTITATSYLFYKN